MVTLLVRHDRTVTVACADTSELLDAVECKIGVPRWATWLCFAGKRLEGGKSLTHYGLSAGSTVHVATRGRGGAPSYADQRTAEIEELLSTLATELMKEEAANPARFLMERLHRMLDTSTGSSSDAYLNEKKADIEALLSTLVTELVEAKAPDPKRFLLERLQRMVNPDASVADTSDTWSLASWVQGTGVHRVIAEAMQRSGEDDLAFVRALKSRDELAARLQTVTERVVDKLWREAQTLQEAGVATEAEMQGKFAGAIELSYGGLDTFYGGLERVVGSPNPRLLEAMRDEHTAQVTESTDIFITGNYGVRTNSKVEWLYAVEWEATPRDAGFEHWPAESETKLPDRTKCRKRRPVAEFEHVLKSRNAQLEQAGQPPVIREELIAANMYTGPVFVKYNAVLRGLHSGSHYLRNTMIQLCCPESVFRQYIGSVPPEEMFHAADGTLSFDEAERSLNKYTTTLHGINSAIIKLSKLTTATKVYRGIAGMKLPPEFWTPNQFGVRGGVEPAFMSSTLTREIAMGYAAGTKMGIVIEVQQGMVNRGADISWVSQYPHEREILFGPLTGIEVLCTRVDGSVVVIECAFSVNLTALTLEQVLSKRRKVVEDMCEQLAIRARHAAQLDEWAILLPSKAVDAFLDERLMPVAKREPEHYNDNAPLGSAIQEAVAMTDILDGWPNKLKALAEVAGEAPTTVEELVRSEGTLALSLKGDARIEVVHGICALLWARSKDAPLSLDLSGRSVGAEGLAALGRAMTPTLLSLNLQKSNCANNGGDNSGIEHLCAGLLRGGGGLTELNLAKNRLNAGAAKAIDEALKTNSTLQTLKCASHTLELHCE